MASTYLSRSFAIGNLTLGGIEPVRIQSMTNTNTNDVEASVEQCQRMINAGAQMLRLTTQGKQEVENLKIIRRELRSRGFHTPVVAETADPSFFSLAQVHE